MNNMITTDHLGRHNTDESAVDSAVNVGSTTMNTQSFARSSEVISPLSLDTQLIKSAHGGSIEDIRDFMAKPVIAGSGVWTTSDTAATSLYGGLYPNTVFGLEVYKKKIAGFLAFRGTIVFRLQVNTMKHQGGRLLLYFHPMGGTAGSYSGGKPAFLGTITQMPNVQFDAASDSEVILKVKYVTPFTHYDITADVGAYGELGLSVYIPLATGTGTTSAEWVIWASFEDVELVTPTYNAQSGRITTKRITQADKEKEALQVSPLSNALTSLSTGMFGAPLLSSLTGTASWASRILNGVASAFGYSKPFAAVQPVRMIQNPDPYGNNSDPFDMSYQMGLSSENQVTVLPGFAGSDIDETALSFIAQIPAYYIAFSFNTGTNVATQLWSTVLEPSVFGQNALDTDAGGYYWFGTPIAFLGSLFSYYRGSLRFTFKFNTTTFHSARVLFVYVPGNIQPTTLDQTNYCYREVFDLRDLREFTVCCPYASTIPWRTTNQFYTNGQPYNGSPYGRAYLYLLTKLQAPDTVSSTVSAIVEVAGDSDIEFAFPRNQAIAPWVSTYSAQLDTPGPQKVTMDSAFDLWLFDNGLPPALILFGENQYEAQMDSPVKGCVTTGTSAILPGGLAASEFCIGEKVTSVLQLLKRFSMMACGPMNTATNTFKLMPFVIGAVANVSSAYSQQTPTCDYYSIICSCYALSRGGVRIMMGNPALFADSGHTNVNFQLSSDQVGSGNTISGYDTSYAGSTGLASRIRTTFEKNPYVAVQVPQYSLGHSRYNAVSGDLHPVADSPYTSAVYLACYLDSSESQEHVFHRAVADDFQLGYWTGTPLLLMNPPYSPSGSA